eukprot:maker-scaffold3473_size8515-snap-gene-0.1 protein:Tk00664 transcript:maker-scaffold3473_size8515-snap-gene-0.1-mRNA-1 annotation:"cuticle protein"
MFALLALTAVVLADNPPPPYRPAPAPYQPEPKYEEPAQYQYAYAVKDEYSQLDFNANEEREGYATSGSYQVLLPDGRTQTVTYSVNGDSGYVADVQYAGEAKYEPYQPKPARKYPPPTPQCYLSGGNQFVFWNDARSKKIKIVWGVKQGGILSPSLLWPLCDLVPFIGAEDNQISGYPDNQALWSVESTIEAVRTRLEILSDRFAVLANINGRILNVAKTQVMFCGKVLIKDLANIALGINGCNVKPSK